MPKTANLAVIGCGDNARAYLRRYHKLIWAGERRFRIVAAVEDALLRARAFAADITEETGWTVTHYKSVADLLNSGTHWVDTVRCWFGKVDSVYARVEQLEKRPHLKGARIVNDTREDF